MKRMMYLIPLLFIQCASPKYATEEQMKHLFIKELPGKSSGEIFDLSQRWIAENFKSAKQVIDLADRNAGTIIAKGIVSNADLGGYVRGKISFTLTLDIKDGRARFNYTNLIPIAYDGTEFPQYSILEKVQLEGQRLLATITDSLSSYILAGKKDF